MGVGRLLGHGFLLMEEGRWGGGDKQNYANCLCEWKVRGLLVKAGLKFV